MKICRLQYRPASLNTDPPSYRINRNVKGVELETWLLLQLNESMRLLRANKKSNGPNIHIPIQIKITNNRPPGTLQ